MDERAIVVVVSEAFPLASADNPARENGKEKRRVSGADNSSTVVDTAVESTGEL